MHIKYNESTGTFSQCEICEGNEICKCGIEISTITLWGEE